MNKRAKQKYGKQYKEEKLYDLCDYLARDILANLRAFERFQLIRGEDSPTSSREAAKWREESPTPHQTKLVRSNDASKRKWVV